MGLYHRPGSSADYELDHLISLELGGTTTQANLWPQAYERRGGRYAAPWQGSETKDQVENRLHDEVCSGQLSLSAAQHQIATNWLTAQ